MRSSTNRFANQFSVAVQGSRRSSSEQNLGIGRALRDSLAAHGDVVRGEFPALDAVAADVHCDDLAVPAGFASTNSVSLNGPVAVQSLDLPSVLSTSQDAVTAPGYATGRESQRENHPDSRSRG